MIYYQSLISLNDKKDVFNTILENNPEKLRWADILNQIHCFYLTHPNFYLTNLQQNIYKKEDYKILEATGLDYNFIDYDGKNLLQHIFDTDIYDRDNEPRRFLFPDEGLPYVIEKTQDMYRLDKYGRNILFGLVCRNIITLEEFDTFITRYPLNEAKDLNIFDSFNQNLLNFSLYHNHVDIAHYLIEKGIGYCHMNHNEQTILHNIVDMPHTPQAVKLFKKVVLDADMSAMGVWEDSLMHFIFRRGDNPGDVYNKWCDTVLKVIGQGQFFHTVESLKRLDGIFDSVKNGNYFDCMKVETQKRFHDMQILIRYTMIELSTPIHENALQPIKKLKI